jgi:hypothetical protein
MTCPCGMKLDSTSSFLYRFRRFDKNGEVIFAICVHGHIIIDKQKEKDEEEIQ